MSSEIAWRAASFTSGDAGKSGNPWAMLTALYCIARRVISRITDSVKRSALADSVFCAAATTCFAPVVDASSAPGNLVGALNGFLPALRDSFRSPRPGERPRFSPGLSAPAGFFAGLQKEADHILVGKLP